MLPLTRAPPKCGERWATAEVVKLTAKRTKAEHPMRTKALCAWRRISQCDPTSQQHIRAIYACGTDHMLRHAPQRTLYACGTNNMLRHQPHRCKNTHAAPTTCCGRQPQKCNMSMRKVHKPRYEPHRNDIRMRQQHLRKCCDPTAQPRCMRHQPRAGALFA